MNNQQPKREKLKLRVVVFSLVMLGLFAVFLFAVPVRTGTPQIFRLRYYALQDGLEGGPLSSSLADFDWRKAFVWRASDTEYRQRQFSQFFEVLTPRLYSHLYYRFGPFMWLPFSLLCVFLIGFLIALVVRQWTGDWLPGMVAGSFWLLTTEVLVGHHAPIRYAKDFATLQILGLISLLLAMRKADRARRNLYLLVAGIVWWLGLFTDEYLIFVFPALAAAFFTWPWLKPVRIRLTVLFLLLLAAGMLLFWFVLPNVITPDQKEPLAKKALDAMPSLGEKVVYNLRYLILNTRDVFTYTFGWPPPHSPVQTILASLTGIVLLSLILINRLWKGRGSMILFLLIAAVAAGGILLPEGTDILHQHTYYNRPLVALLLVVTGLFTASIFQRGGNRAVSAWLVTLSAAGILNFATIAPAVRDDPEEAYLTRYGLEEILQIHERLKSGDLPAPVLVSYPQQEDVVNGVYDELEYLPWHTLDDGTPPWSLYRSLMPRLYLRHFETGELRADPRQFLRWDGVDERRYRSAAKSLYDMPAGVVWDLESIRKAAGLSIAGLTWKSDDGREEEAAVIGDLLGEAPFVSLPPGRWRTEIHLSPEIEEPMLIFALRYRGSAAVSVPEAAVPREIEPSYLWSFRMHAIRIRTGGEKIAIFLESEGGAEMIGPRIVSSRAVAPVPPSAREDVPPAGVPLLELRGHPE